jgi:hypothetical protein
MGGTTQTKDTNSAFNQNSLQQFRSGTTGASSGTTNPWEPAQPYLSGILAQLQGQLPATSLTPTESSALGGLADSAGYITQFLPGATSLATDLLAGGGPDRSGLASSAYDAYKAALTPFARGDYVNPASNPALQPYLETIRNDVANQVNGMFAGAGRDLSGLNQQTLARGIAQGEAPLLLDAYNRALADQRSAIDALYGAGGTTAGLLSSLDQTRLANRRAGLDVAGTGASFAMDPFNRQLATEAARRGIPLSTLQMLVQLGVPIAGLGSAYTGATSGTQAGNTSGQQSGTGTSTTTTSTPFNPLSLLPLAFAPLSGGASLAGMGASALGGGLFGLLSNGFMGPGSFTGR